LQWHEGDSDVDATWVDLLPVSAYSTVTSYTVTDGLTSGYSYSFRVRAVNFWGEGQYSSTTVLVASTSPETALTPTTSIDTATGDLVISWSDPDDRGSAIAQYLIEIRDKAASQWLQSSYCDGTNTDVKAARQCSIPMLTLTSGDYAYYYGDLIYVRMSAYNDKGWSQVSPVNSEGATAVVYPQAVGTPTRSSETSPTQLQVSWAALTTDAETGGLTIISYELEYDKGTGDAIDTASWTTLLGNPSDSLLTEYLVAGDTIIGGTDYQFRVRAKNALGWGDWSSIGTVAASAAPSEMAAVTTQIDPADALAVEISWTAPTNNYDALTEYEVLILQSDGVTYAEEPATCDGTGNTDMLNDRECSIPLQTLRTDFGLVYGDLVTAKVRARNSIDFGPYS
jgi:hypothetical protein